MTGDGRLCLVFKAKFESLATSMLGLRGIGILLGRLAFSVLCRSRGRSGNQLRRVLSCCGYIDLLVCLRTLGRLPHLQHVAGIWQLLAFELLLFRPRECIRQVDRHKALGKLDGVELGTQRLDDLFPVTMRRQGPPLRAANAVLAVELDVQRIIDVTSRADGNADAVIEGRVAFACGGALWLIGLGLVKLEGDM